MAPLSQIGKVLDRARAVANEYYQLTGRPLGITGEMGEYQAARLLGLELAPARAPGYDAVDKSGRKFQVKTRCIDADSPRRAQRVGAIKLDHEWHAVLLVLVDRKFDAVGIWEAGREEIMAALAVPGSKARNERGALAVSKFKSIGRQVWPVTKTQAISPKA